MSHPEEVRASADGGNRDGRDPSRPGSVIGDKSPVTAMRMGCLTSPLLQAGLKRIIAKSGHRQAVRNALKNYKAVYFFPALQSIRYLSPNLTANDPGLP